MAPHRPKAWQRILTAMACSVVVVGCDGTAGAPSVSGHTGGGDPEGAMIQPESTRKDFGLVVSGTPLSHDFVLRNPGKKNLEIWSLSTSCGCTAAVMSDTDRTIPPGGEGRIRVAYTAEGAEPFANWVLVYSNVESASPVRLDIFGESRYALEGPERIDLGSVTTGQPRTEVIRLRAAKGVDFKIAKAGTSLPYLRAEAVREGDEATLTLTFDGHPAPQAIAGWAWIDTDREHDDRVVIPLVGTIEAPIRAEPPRIYLGTAPVGQRKSGTVRLTADRDTLANLTVEVEGPDWVQTDLERNGSQAKLVVSLGPEAKEGRTAGRVWVRAAGGEAIAIPFHAFVSKYVARSP